MSLPILIVAVGLGVLLLLLVFRRRSLWFVLERRRQALQDTSLSASMKVREWSWGSRDRIPARLQAQSPGVAVGAFLGAGMLAVFGLALVLGESGLAIETVCGFMGCSADLPLLPDPGLSFALSLVAGAVFWGMVVLELLGKTHFSDWIRADNPEAAGRPGGADAMPGFIRRLLVPSVAGAMFGLSVALVVSLAFLRGVFLAEPNATAPAESLAHFMGTHRLLLVFQQTGGALLVSVSAAFGLVAMKDFLNLTISGLVFGLLSGALCLIRWGVQAAAFLLDMVMGIIQDLVHIVDPEMEESLSLPNQDFALWEDQPDPAFEEGEFGEEGFHPHDEDPQLGIEEVLADGPDPVGGQEDADLAEAA